jgi:hypothetical protein
MGWVRVPEDRGVNSRTSEYRNEWYPYEHGGPVSPVVLLAAGEASFQRVAQDCTPDAVSSFWHSGAMS